MSGAIFDPGGSSVDNQLGVALCGETDQPKQVQAILYIDHQSLTRECVGQQLAKFLPDIAVVTVASVEDIPKEAGDAYRFLVGIIHKHASPVRSQELAIQLQHLSDLAPYLPLVFLSDIDDADEIREAFGLGVRGYIPINLPIKQVVEAIRLVGAGGSYVPPSVLCLYTRHRMPQTDVGRNEAHCKERFSPRQMEVLKHLWEGKQNKAIAYHLKMCESTVKVHIRHIMKRLNARNRTQVVLLTCSMDENGSSGIVD